MSPIKKMAALLAVLLWCASGCWDKVEIENRAFAVALGIDKATSPENGFVVTLALPDNEKAQAAEPANDAKDAKKTSRHASGKTVTEAIRKLDAESGKKLYLGQIKVILLGTSLLADTDLFRQALDTLERHTEIDRRVTLLATENIDAILEASTPGYPSAGMYIETFYRSAEKAMGRTFHKDFEKLTSELRATGSTLIPLIQTRDETLQLSGVTALNDHQQVGTLNAQETRGFLWSRNQACQGAVITVNYENNPIPITITKNKVTLRFSEVETDNSGETEALLGKRLQCMMAINITGDVASFYFDSFESLSDDDTLLAALSRLCETAIAAEITTAAEKARQLSIDVFQWETALRKMHYPLYQRYAEDWADVFDHMEVIPQVQVTLQHTGAVR